jgi:uncharacterized protein YraI
LALCGLAQPAAAEETRGVTNASVDLLSGPGDTYPSVSHVASGADVRVMGCVDGFAWCDVAWGDQRGWIDGHFLDAIYSERHVNVIDIGRSRGIPVEVFEQKTYWDNYYKDRPFYTEHRYWTTTPP